MYNNARLTIEYSIPKSFLNRTPSAAPHIDPPRAGSDERSFA